MPPTLTLSPEPTLAAITSSKDDGIAYQNKMAANLRKTAIDWLAHGHGVVAKNFRGEFTVANIGNDGQKFLEKQSRPGVWGTYIEATALAEKLGVNLVVTSRNAQGQENTFVLYKAENLDAPTVFLHNNKNQHWSSMRSTTPTAGDGNCLYNAIAQELHFIAKNPEQAQKSPPQQVQVKTWPTAAVSAPKEQDILKHQHDIEEKLARTPKPSEVEKNLLAEKERIAKLSPQEQKQIASDYRYALKIAAQGFDDAQEDSSPKLR